jgi:hypothetical protein
VVATGSPWDINAAIENDADLKSALTALRKEGDVVTGPAEGPWRVNARETLDRGGVIARAKRLSSIRQILGRGAA